jgi:radical SAM enzyme (TIGR01210 family)
MSDKLAKIIQKRTEESNKTYSFKEDHNPRLPADYWFQTSTEGPVLFLVFFTQACRWAKCLGCNLPSKVSLTHIGFMDIMKQTNFVFMNLLSDRQKIELKKIILSNNGSVLDEETLSTTALLYFISQMNIHCPDIRVLTIESRAEYVDRAELETIHRTIQEGDTPTDLEIAIGFEAFDDKIRNEHFKKGLPLEVVENLADMISQYKFRLKAYFMLKPVPNLSEKDAIEDIKAGIHYLDSLAKKYNIEINMHLNPTFASKGTPLAEAFKAGTFVPPLLESVKQAVRASEGTRISVFAGLNDEGLAVPGGSFIRPGDEALIDLLEKFNRTQDYSLLE